MWLLFRNIISTSAAAPKKKKKALFLLLLLSTTLFADCLTEVFGSSFFENIY